MIATISVCEVVWNYYWIGLLVLAGGWGLFERKSKSEHKAQIRTATGVGLALLSVLAGFWIVGITAVSYALVTPAYAASARAQIPISATPVQYGDHYYQVFERPDGIEWDDAKAECEAMGGYLVSINDADENAFLTSIGAGKRVFHLGANDADIEGDWRWIDGTVMTYQNWREGEPREDPARHPVEIRLRAEPWVWPEWTAGPSRGEGFICEWDRKPEGSGGQ